MCRLALSERHKEVVLPAIYESFTFVPAPHVERFLRLNFTRPNLQHDGTSA